MSRKITTKRLYLEPMTAADTEDWWAAIWSDTEVTRFLPPRRPVPRDHMDRLVEKAMSDVSIYVLGADMKARGVDESKIIDGIKVIDYKGFVDLAVENDKVNAWL